MQTSKSLVIAAACFAALCTSSAAWAADPDTDMQAKAREALRQKMQAAEEEKAAPTGSFAEVPTASGGDSAAVQKAREALHKKMAQIEKDPSQTAGSEAEARAMRNARRSAPVQFAPIEKPASPLPSEKQEQLAELLKRYRADELTPEEYHRERAKILGLK